MIPQKQPREGPSTVRGGGKGTNREGQLHPHSGIPVVNQLQGRRHHRGTGVTFRQAQGVFPDPGLATVQSLDQLVLPKRPHPVQHSQRMWNCLRQVRLVHQGTHQWEHSPVVSPQKFLLSLVANPAVGRTQPGHEIRGIESGQARNITRGMPDPPHPVDPTPVLSVTIERQELLLPFLGKPLRMLDYVAVDVGHPETTVGSGPHHHRSAPAIAARKEVRLLLLSCPPCLEGDS